LQSAPTLALAIMQQYSDEEGFSSDDDVAVQQDQAALDPEAAQIAEENRLAAEQLPQPVKQVRRLLILSDALCSAKEEAWASSAGLKQWT
jgi:hypothetical protein